MTFTRRPGETSYRCDRCGLSVGRSWRGKRDHECPPGRGALTETATTCDLAECGQPLRRRPTESSPKFRVRRFCNGSCATRHTNRKRSAA